MMSTFYRWSSAVVMAGVAAGAAMHAQAPARAAMRIEVTAAASLGHTPVDGRLFVVLGKAASPEPRTAIGRTGMDAAPGLMASSSWSACPAPQGRSWMPWNVVRETR